MSEELDMMRVFGQWLTEKTLQQEAMLYSICANVKHSSDAIRLKYGHLEAYKDVLKHFSEMFEKGSEKFKKEYLEEDIKEQDGTEDS